MDCNMEGSAVRKDYIVATPPSNMSINKAARIGTSIITNRHRKGCKFSGDLICSKHDCALCPATGELSHAPMAVSFTTCSSGSGFDLGFWFLTAKKPCQHSCVAGLLVAVFSSMAIQRAGLYEAVLSRPRQNSTFLTEFRAAPRNEKHCDSGGSNLIEYSGHVLTICFSAGAFCG